MGSEEVSQSRWAGRPDFHSTPTRMAPVFSVLCIFLITARSLLIYLFLFLAALGLRCCARAFPSCGEWGLLFIAVRGLLIAVASLVAEHAL